MEDSENTPDKSSSLKSFEENSTEVSGKEVSVERAQDEAPIDSEIIPSELNGTSKDAKDSSDEEGEQLVKPSRPNFVVDSDDEALDDEDLDLIQENLGLKSRVEVG